MQEKILRPVVIKSGRLFIPALIAGALFFLPACNHKPAAISLEANTISQTDSDVFHADNDIAMTLRSIADALNVGEPLDSTLYDFEGVLTDGQGTPLYTDIQGAPGLWDVDVLDSKNVIIKNIYLGDLLPLDLQGYILESLGLDETDHLEFTAHEAVDDEDTEIDVFSCGNAFLRFEVRAGIAPNGIEGPQLSIIMSADPPAGGETQTADLAQIAARP